MAESCLSTSPTPGPESPLKTKDSFPEHDLQLERRAIRKLDYTILPVITLFYLASILDRSNIGNARVAGLQKDLHLTDKQYQICITVLFAPYIAGQLPAGLLLKKIGPSLLLPTVVTVWGIVATSQGFVTSYGGLITARVFLGLVEGPLTSGIIIYLSSFYTRKELSLRIAIFSSASALSSAFSGLLAAAIENMNGIGGRPGWAWIFILEGMFSSLIGIVGFFLVPSTPRDSKFLTEDQKELIMRRLEKDRPSIALVERFSFKEVMRSACSPHVIMVVTMTFMTGMMGYGLTLFLPSIVSQLGFSPNKTQLLSVGPFATGFLVTLIAAFLSDRYRSRGAVVISVSILGIAGFAVFLCAEHRFVSYGALYLMVPGVGVSPVINAWLANNSEPHYRRATSIALGVLVANSGGILSTWSFPTKDGPRFRKTTTINLTLYVTALLFHVSESAILVLVCAFINMAYLSWRNEVKKRPGVRSKLLDQYEAGDKEGNTDGGLRAWIRLGDRHPDFEYTV